LLLLVFFALTKTNAQVGIGTTTPKAALDVFSGTDGLLIPRVALTNTTTVSPVLSGTESELVYNTTLNGFVTPGFYYLSAPGGPWVRLAAGTTGWLTTGNTGIVDDYSNYIGTYIGTDVDVRFGRQGLPAGKIGKTSTSFGVGAANANTAAGTTAFGVRALAANAVAEGNTAVGYRALAASTEPNNTAVGYEAGKNLTSTNNTAIGFNTLVTDAGANNVAVGSEALKVVGTLFPTSNEAKGNTGVGFQAGNTITTGSNNTVIGSGAQASSPTTDDSVTLGNGAIATFRCSAPAITSLSDRRDKTNIKKLSEGITFIKKLKPVTFTWNTRDKLKVGVKASGFIAQDLLKLQKESSIGENLDLVDDENPERYEARYGNLLPVMISGMQEQQKLIEKLQKANAELVKTNAGLLKSNLAILKRLENLEKKKSE
jgi:hypothetical protein